jgi:predicted ABC-type ATPase
MTFNKPLLIVIGGPNGSGKTTLSSKLIERGRIKSKIINPDAIAYDEFGSYRHQIKAAKLALLRRKTALNNREDFAFESTFSGKSEINDIITAKESGYEVILYYVALRSVIDNVTRVEERQTDLGHDVGYEDILRRHTNSQLNPINNISLFDTAYLFDNSASSRSRVAIFLHGQLAWVNPKHAQHPFFKELLKG